MKKNMESEESAIQQHPTQIEMVLTPAVEVYAGTDVSLQVKVSCPEKCDLQGSQVGIINEEGVVVHDVVLTAYDEDTNQTDEFMITVPVQPGSYTWTALFLAQEGAEVRHAESAVPFTFSVIPHRIDTSVWGMPRPVMLGGKFAVKVGAKCSAGCSLARLPFAVYDDAGNQVSIGQLGDVPLSQTSGLLWSEQELEAPDAEGLYTWSVQCLVSELALPHQASSTNFTFKTARPPDHTIIVEVVDKDHQRPVKGASVYVHPYRSTTDEKGVASLQVTSGTHELFVKLKDYDDYQTALEVAGDITVQVEMFWVPDPYA